jgi:hypothetical protein
MCESIMTKEEIYLSIKGTIADFGGKPSKDVANISNMLRTAGFRGSIMIGLLQYIYIRLCQESKGADLNQARQSWVTVSGNHFEEMVRDFVNDSLNPEGILAVKGDRIKKNPKAIDIVNFLTLKANRRCTQTITEVWPDSDIILLTRDRSTRLKAFALLNCKTSDHSRNDAVLFWALALRDNNIKYCLVTQDLDGRFVKGDHDRQISSLRKKCEAYLDRVFTTNLSTEECAQIKKIDFTSSHGADSFLEDLRLWRREVVPDSFETALDEKVLA